jgi:hypothetical protein
MLESSKYTSGPGIGGILTTLIGLLVTAGVLTPEQGSIVSLHIVPIIGGVIAIIGAFTVFTLPTPPVTDDTSKKDPFSR